MILNQMTKSLIFLILKRKYEYFMLKNMITFLSDDIGLDNSSIELGINLSIKKYSLPILLWSYGLLNIEELDRLYSYLYNYKD